MTPKPREIYNNLPKCKACYGRRKTFEEAPTLFLMKRKMGSYVSCDFCEGTGLDLLGIHDLCTKKKEPVDDQGFMI